MAIPPTLPPILPGQDEDYQLQYGYIREWCTKRLPQFPYYRLNTNMAQVDDLHSEIIDSEKSWKTYKYVRGYMEPQNTEQNQEKMGQDWIDDMMLYISLPSLVQAELATVDYEYRLENLYTQNGDRLWYCDHLYEVVNHIDLGMWGPDGYSPMWYEYKLVHVRPYITGSTGYDFNPSGS